MIYYRVMNGIIYRVLPHYSWRNRSKRLGSRETKLSRRGTAEKKNGVRRRLGNQRSRAKRRKGEWRETAESAIKSAVPGWRDANVSEQSNGPAADNLVEAFRHLGSRSFRAR